MRYIVFTLFILSLSGCYPDKDSSALCTVLQEVKCMIRRDSFPDKYVIVYEITSNDVGSIYKVTSSDSPFVEPTLEGPERIIKVEDKYICMISPTSSSDMSEDEILEITDYKNDTLFSIREKMWYIGVSKDGRRKTLVSTNRTYLSWHFYTFPQLLEYVFSDYNAQNVPRYILGTYSLTVDDLNRSKGDLKNHIQYLTGDIYYVDTFNKHFNSHEEDQLDKNFFAVLHGKDTLRLNIKDTIEHHLIFESEKNALFFSSLPEKESWYKLYDLLSDSTFYFRYEQGKYIKQPIPFGNARWHFMVQDSLSQWYELYKKGVRENLLKQGCCE